MCRCATRRRSGPSSPARSWRRERRGLRGGGNGPCRPGMETLPGEVWQVARQLGRGVLQDVLCAPRVRPSAAHLRGACEGHPPHPCARHSNPQVLREAAGAGQADPKHPLASPKRSPCCPRRTVVGRWGRRGRRGGAKRHWLTRALIGRHLVWRARAASRGAGDGLIPHLPPLLLPLPRVYRITPLGIFPAPADLLYILRKALFVARRRVCRALQPRTPSRMCGRSAQQHRVAGHAPTRGVPQLRSASRPRPRPS